jgi:hypothetical protein
MEVMEKLEIDLHVRHFRDPLRGDAEAALYFPPNTTSAS